MGQRPCPDAHWFTYLTHDLIHAVDAHLRTIRMAAGRGIGGYSSGADAALNAILLRPHLYAVAEGWSGDYRQTPATVGHDAALVRHFSALDTAPLRAPELAATGAHVYLYTGRRDRVMPETMRVAHALRSAGVHTLVDLTGGGHAWALWSRPPGRVAALLLGPPRAGPGRDARRGLLARARSDRPRRVPGRRDSD